MILNNRIIFSDNGVLSDLTTSLNDYRAGDSVTAAVATEDYLYLGSDLPFNHRYVEIGTANDQASVLSVEYWSNGAWVSAVDVLDQTAVAGKSLAQSGHISWVADKRKSWSKKDTDDGVTGLSTLTIYNLYWARFKWSANLKASTSIKFMGQKFSGDADLKGRYPDLGLSNVYAQWPNQSPTKTNWDEQHYEAAEEIIKDLRKKGAIYSGSQILNWELFREASVHKTASIVMNAFGKDFKEPVEKAEKDYANAMNLFLFEVDQNKNTLLDEHEALPSLDVFRR
jgi:hypothetical protein